MSPQRDRVSRVELRAGVSLASTFGLRLLGMFIILPVFAIYAGQLPGGDDLTLAASRSALVASCRPCCRFRSDGGRISTDAKRVICIGLAIFTTGSFIAAAAPNISSALSGACCRAPAPFQRAVMAIAAYLTREAHRTKAMTMIGSTIGAAFAFSLIASPWLTGLIGGYLFPDAGACKVLSSPMRRCSLCGSWRRPA